MARIRVGIISSPDKDYIHMADLIGQEIGQYKIVALLGEGGMAGVYRAHDRRMKRDVAIKIIKHHLIDKAEFIQRFEREAYTVAALSHPFILKVFAFGEEEELVYLVMEMMAGGTLAQEIQRGPLPLDIVTRMLDQIASALDYAHQKGILHRDLKPHNVLLDDAGNGHLSDFGIAKILNEASNLTQSGAAMGTPAYMSPEQWQGKALDARTDLYSLGVMLFEMLTGELPFAGDTPASLMYKHLNEPSPSLRKRRRELPGAVDAVLKRALAKEPDHRYATATAFAAAFKEALEDESDAPTLRRQPIRIGSPRNEDSNEDMVVTALPSVAASTAVGNARSKRNLPRLTVLVIVVAVVALLVAKFVFVPGAAISRTATATVSLKVAALPSATVNLTPTLDALGAAKATNAVEATVNAARTSLLIQGQTATATRWTATPTDPATLPPTLTRVSSKTLIPSPTSPTSTPLRLPVDLGQDVGVTYREDFHGPNAPIWVVNQKFTDNGLEVTGDKINWTGPDNVHGDLRTNSGTLLLFKYSADPVTNIITGLNSGVRDATDYREWMFQIAPGNHSSFGFRVGTVLSFPTNFSTKPNTWYYLLVRIGSDGQFNAKLWERDHPATYVANLAMTPTGGNWDNRKWTYGFGIFSGTVAVRLYEELLFPVGYKTQVPPAQPNS